MEHPVGVDGRRGGYSRPGHGCFPPGHGTLIPERQSETAGYLRRIESRRPQFPRLDAVKGISAFISLTPAFAHPLAEQLPSTLLVPFLGRIILRIFSDGFSLHFINHRNFNRETISKGGEDRVSTTIKNIS